MTRHLSPEESIAAVERTLDGAAAAHLAACDRCQRDIAALAAVLRDVEAAKDPAEPSPLFWDHFSARVSGAARAEAASRSAWSWWRPAAGIAAAALVVTWLGFRAWTPAPGPADGGNQTETGNGAGAAAVVDDPWDAVVELARDLSMDDVTGAVPLRLDTVLFDELTPEEQQTVVELLQAEMKGLE